jgi:hypothetical protein
MSILAADFGQYVVQDALEILANMNAIPYSETAYNLLMGTAAQESLLGTYLVQQSGPGIGPFMQTPSEVPAMLAACNANTLSALASVSHSGSSPNQIITNLVYAAMICRIFYWQVPAPLPDNTLAGLWGYYKEHYNTATGAATQTQWNTNWGLTGISLPAN